MAQLTRQATQHTHATQRNAKPPAYGYIRSLIQVLSLLHSLIMVFLAKHFLT
ncbi:hypothetical protein COCSADRAFT_35531 [Bipolaris sorokiniana ND90Pr]|uniref:Uncharacterized protein n=1 Tax=Cochliobolus sativus (strain ND90Pr / ATCC 201652) TaxID=665912 RepID=M2T8C1_COCSN|nr:uncharacterized protein COCSADRAFT_35531 [Bipolaris sorokiniana ND90Pr]EMD65491.1 hypothetical protein COCSADRAFT_35531 [Bipolaris sorokiniana ND90Pr]